MQRFSLISGRSRRALLVIRSWRGEADVLSAGIGESVSWCSPSLQRRGFDLIVGEVFQSAGMIGDV
ncbi:MAG: hypothetical protein ACXU8R_12635, partial [Xanthobacteraceae bacterium]